MTEKLPSLRLDGNTIYLQKKRISLDPKQALILKLISRTDEGIPEHELMRQLWPEGGDHKVALRSLISRLRRKLESYPPYMNLITFDHGSYRLLPTVSKKKFSRLWAVLILTLLGLWFFFQKPTFHVLALDGKTDSSFIADSLQNQLSREEALKALFPDHQIGVEVQNVDEILVCYLYLESKNQLVWSQVYVTQKDALEIFGSQVGQDLIHFVSAKELYEVLGRPLPKVLFDKPDLNENTTSYRKIFSDYGPRSFLNLITIKALTDGMQDREKFYLAWDMVATGRMDLADHLLEQLISQKPTFDDSGGFAQKPDPGVYANAIHLKGNILAHKGESGWETLLLSALHINVKLGKYRNALQIYEKLADNCAIFGDFDKAEKYLKQRHDHSIAWEYPKTESFEWRIRAAMSFQKGEYVKALSLQRRAAEMENLPEYILSSLQSNLSYYEMFAGDIQVGYDMSLEAMDRSLAMDARSTFYGILINIYGYYLWFSDDMEMRENLKRLLHVHVKQPHSGWFFRHHLEKLESGVLKPLPKDQRI